MGAFKNFYNLSTGADLSRYEAEREAFNRYYLYGEAPKTAEINARMADIQKTRDRLSWQRAIWGGAGLALGGIAAAAAPGASVISGAKEASNAISAWLEGAVNTAGEWLGFEGAGSSLGVGQSTNLAAAIPGLDVAEEFLSDPSGFIGPRAASELAALPENARQFATEKIMDALRSEMTNAPELPRYESPAVAASRELGAAPTSAGSAPQVFVAGSRSSISATPLIALGVLAVVVLAAGRK